MRSYRGARLLTGKAGSARARLDTRGFVCTYQGVHCRGCGMPISVGARVKSPGKGMGAYHLDCKMFTDRRPASDEREAQRAEIKESIRSWNSIR